jgi:HAE1 family hydrophobic/amphiphilic exporter-1
MASSVATPIERRLSTIAGISSLSSISTQGRTRVVVQFSLERNIDDAALDVQAALQQAQRRMPPEMTSPPTYYKSNPADYPVLYLALTSSTLPLYEVNEYAETLIAQRISMIDGVAQVSVYGQKKYAVRIQLDPDLLAARGIGIDEVANAVAAANANLPTGALDGSKRASSIMATGQLYNAEQFKPSIVAWRNGAPVRLSELGTVIDSEEQNKSINWYTGVPGIVLAVQRQPGTNTIEVVNSIRELLPMFISQLPAALKLEVMYDRSQSIRESVHDVQFTLILTVFLVIGVIFLFLRNLAATIIPSLALPMSIISTFALMYALGYSVDNLSLMALTLAVGFVVDDAIVMLENIMRHREMGKNRLQAALDASKEIGFTILSMTLSLVAVFIPVVFMGGIAGRLFREFSVVIIIAILFSGLVSLTLTPMMGAVFLREQPRVVAPPEGAVGRLERGFGLLFRLYETVLRAVMRHKGLIFGASLLLLAGTVHFFIIMPKGFLPSDDTDMIDGYTNAEQSISYQGMVAAQTQLHAILLNDPAVRAFSSVVGAGGPNQSVSNGRLSIRLKPQKERGHIDGVIDRLRTDLNVFPELQVFLVNPPLINIGGRSSKSLYQYTLQGPDTQALYRAGAEVELALRALPQLSDVTSDLQIKNPELRIRIDRDKAAALGVSVQQIELALQSAYGSREISTIYAPTNDYAVIMELKPEFQQNPKALHMLYVRTSTGELVPLDTLATMERAVGPLAVNHSAQFPSVTIAFNLAPGLALSEGVALAERTARPLIPASVSASFQGTAQAFQDSMRGMPLLLLTAVLVIYLVLGMLYESFIHPLTILSGLPSAACGALLTLYLFHMDLNLYAFVGIIMLIGIVKKNAIMMLDFALEAERRNHLPPEEAIVQGCLIRFRPIMMTTFAAIMGALPIAIGIGAGAEARRPLGLAVVGGLCVSQLVTLLITPVYYVYMDKLAGFVGRRKARSRNASAGNPPQNPQENPL